MSCVVSVSSFKLRYTYLCR